MTMPCLHCPFKIHMVPNSHCDGIIRQGLWEVTESLGVHAHAWKACLHRKASRELMNERHVFIEEPPESSCIEGKSSLKSLQRAACDHTLCQNATCLLLASRLPGLQIHEINVSVSTLPCVRYFIQYVRTKAASSQ